ncbi:helix-turn-helix transcriptional regulator [bacterium]|nr:helix-turn-helix transcriptional regulator [bacterium]
MREIDYGRDSDLLKALGHPVRLKIVAGLMSGHECNVTTMVENLKLPQSTVSQHLSILKNNGIIAFRKEGVKTCYRVVNQYARAIINELTR